MSFVIFLLLLGTLSLGGYAYLIEPGPEGRIRYLKSTGKLLLYKYSLVDKLMPREVKRLYKSTCTRKCHSRDVIEGKPRTSMEWGQIVERMGQPDRADLSFNEKRTIVEYLQRNFLSNVPTLLPDHTMRFLKKHVWRLDFGDEDLYFDIIYMPLELRRFMPFLAMKARPTDAKGAAFIVYVNTHSGIIPDWDMSEITVIEDDAGNELEAIEWQVLFEDVDKHHRQGILSFPAISEGAKSLVLTIRPKGMRQRSYQWSLPIPKYVEPPKQAEAEAGK